MPKDQTALAFDIEYCGSWGGRPEADYTAKILKTVYPNSTFNIHTPGHTANLIVSLGSK